ncbi:hypothetical protein VIGAN_04294700 [Vigna angularis var. angularis]|uniref:Translin n=1 Tax=Vigna angularis var. angularis TaxID=157739 RepID=A0A0S3RXR5_PHAAN|nr:hypothetical protein VIGAN_04294700 [Vigna angularis var. angularis]
MAEPQSSLEKQFDAFRVHLEQSGTLRDRIRSVVSEIESSTRLIYATLLLVHQSRPTPGTTEHLCSSSFLNHNYISIPISLFAFRGLSFMDLQMGLFFMARVLNRKRQDLNIYSAFSGLI